jgi:hypothetical protein
VADVPGWHPAYRRDMTGDRDSEPSTAHRVWTVVLGIGWLLVIAVTIYLTRDLDPRSWFSRPDWLDLPDLPWYLKLIGPVKILVLVVVITLAAIKAHGRTRGSQGDNGDAASSDDRPSE